MTETYQYYNPDLVYPILWTIFTFLVLYCGAMIFVAKDWKPTEDRGELHHRSMERWVTATFIWILILVFWAGRWTAPSCNHVKVRLSDGNYVEGWAEVKKVK